MTEQSKEQELVKKIAEVYITSGKDFEKVCLALIKEALPELAKEMSLVILHEDEVEDFVYNTAKANGYVKLANDQSLPIKQACHILAKEIEYEPSLSYEQRIVEGATDYMFKEGWRKVEVKDGS